MSAKSSKIKSVRKERMIRRKKKKKNCEWKERGEAGGERPTNDIIFL